MIVSHISELAGRHRMNIRDIARGAGISYPTAHRLYHDTADRFDKRTLNGLCRLFRCDVGDLFSYQPDDVDEQHETAEPQTARQPTSMRRRTVRNTTGETQ